MGASMNLLLLCSTTLLLPTNALSSRQQDESRLLGSNIGYMRPGSLSNSPASETSINQLFETAGRQPNASTSISFPLSPGNLSAIERNPTWTWHLNTTDLAIPEEILPGNLRAVNQQWALTWPGGGNLQSALNKWGIQGNRTRELCFGTASWVLLSNITERYVGAEAGDCEAVLGTACADRIRSQSLLGRNGRCGALSGNFDECADTVGLVSGGGSLGTGSGFDQANSSDTFYYETSPALPADELEEYYAQAERSLQVLLVKDVPVSGRSTAGQLLCHVVNPEVASGGVSLRPKGYMIGISVMMGLIWGFVDL